LSSDDFNSIIQQGLADTTPLLPRVDDALLAPGFHEDQKPLQFEQERERVTSLTSRVVRDRIFRRIVLRAYDERCAITGLKLINGSGRAEVAAAHIRPVEAHGPDIVSNGIALSGTAHWMFDRGLISLADDREILVSRQVNDPDGVRALINKSGQAIAPRRPSDRPHPHFLQWHRNHCFKQ
jgi:putative restriction endonuclease